MRTGTRAMHWGAAGAAILVGLWAAPCLAGKPKLKETVNFARTWDEAVAEARMLNLPIVVHNHGFYCSPCWGMHSAVLQNKKYIQFAEKNTVEVIALGDLQKGIDAKERRAETYAASRDGKDVEMLVEFPGLTAEEMIALNGSPAGQFNKTGFVPYTSIVDPHTLQEVKGFNGGSGSMIMEEVEALKKKLVQQHGAGVARAEIRALDEAAAEAAELAGKGEFAKALAEIEAVSGKRQEWPKPLADKIGKARKDVVAGAEQALAAVEGLVGSDPAKARRELQRLQPRLAGTGLEERAEALNDELAG